MLCPRFGGACTARHQKCNEEIEKWLCCLLFFFLFFPSFFLKSSRGEDPCTLCSIQGGVVALDHQPRTALLPTLSLARVLFLCQPMDGGPSRSPGQVLFCLYPTTTDRYSRSNGDRHTFIYNPWACSLKHHKSSNVHGVVGAHFPLREYWVVEAVIRLAYLTITCGMYGRDEKMLSRRNEYVTPPLQFVYKSHASSPGWRRCRTPSQCRSAG